MILDWMVISICFSLFWSLHQFLYDRKGDLTEDLKSSFENGALFIIFLTIQVAALSRLSYFCPLSWRVEFMIALAYVFSYLVSYVGKQKAFFFWFLFILTTYLLWEGQRLHWEQKISGSLYVATFLLIGRILFFSLFERLRFSEIPEIFKGPAILLAGAAILSMALWKVQEIILIW